MAKKEVKNNSKALVVKKPKADIPVPAESSILPAIPPKEWIEKYKEFLANYDEFIDSQMKENIDYGTIPGTQKPTLYQAGAQKLEKLFFLRSKTTLKERIVKSDYSFVKYTYRTSAFRGDTLIATCEGSCNSKEKKYRYETLFLNEATEEQQKKGEIISKISRNSKPYQIVRIEKKEFYDIENTIMKMAQKRSYVGAILIATNSSGRFTQDLEDMDMNGKEEETQSKSQTGQYGEPLKEPFPDKPKGQPRPTTATPIIHTIIHKCSDCGEEITKAEMDYSEKNFGMKLCRNCQTKYRKKV